MIKIKVFLIPKKKSLISVALVLLLVLCGITAITASGEEQMVMSYGVANKVIAVDPGHGGQDTGATRGEVVEKEITLKISQKLARELSQAGAGVILIRDTDTDLVGKDFSGTNRKRADLGNRVKMANQARADLYISVHTNADPNPRWSGAQTFYHPQSETSKMVAETIQEELTRMLGNTTRKALAGDYYIMKNTKMPAVLVEVGFISNPQEARLLTDEVYQAKVAHAIFSGIVKAQIKGDNLEPNK